MIVLAHVDDMAVFFNDAGRGLRDKIWAHLKKHLDIRNQGLLRYFLKMSIEYDKDAGIMKISQPYHEDLFQIRFKTGEWKERDTPLPASGKFVMARGDHEAMTPEEAFAASQFQGGNLWVMSFVC